MKWIPILSLPAAVLCSGQEVDAGVLSLFQRHPSATCCDCAPSRCCKPTIVRPSHCAAYCYQRQQACLKPTCCDAWRAPTSCAPVCAAPVSGGTCCDVDCCPDAPCCELPCCDDCCPVPCCADASRLADLICTSQAACYPRQRKEAIHRLGDRFHCDCYPQVMDALIHALNDSDPYVRRKAADEIGDQLRRSPDCCSSCIVSALTCALADCDRGTCREAEKALKLCGYDIVDACGLDCCDMTDFNFEGTSELLAPTMEDPATRAPAPHEEEAPAPPEGVVPDVSTSPASLFSSPRNVAPAPPLEPSTYYRTKREFMESTARPSKGRTGLAGLFGLAK